MPSRRNSGRARQRHDLYETDAWVVLDGLVGWMPVRDLVVLEMACGRGKMVRALHEAGAREVLASDKVRRKKMDLPEGVQFVRADFTKAVIGPAMFDALITNPPYGHKSRLAEAFIERGLQYLRGQTASPARPRFMALLLSDGFDLAACRQHLFETCPEFYGTIYLRRRIWWFKPKPKKTAKGKKAKRQSGPSGNHAWFIWKAEPRPLGVLPVKMYAPSTGQLL